MDASDIQVIDAAARTALSLLDTLVSTHGDRDTYLSYFKIDDSHKAVKLVFINTRSWLMAYLSRQSWSGGPRAQVKLVRSSACVGPAADVDPESHELTFFDKFFKEVLFAGSMRPGSYAIADRDPGFWRATVLIHQIVRYVSYHNRDDFFNLLTPACQKFGCRLAITSIVQIEARYSNDEPGSKAEKRAMKGKKYHTVPSDSKWSKSFRFSVYQQEAQRAKLLPWETYKYHTGVFGVLDTQKLVRRNQDGELAAMFNADNYACYVASVAVKSMEMHQQGTEEVEERGSQQGQGGRQGGVARP